MLISIETHKSCAFLGGGGVGVQTSYPPLDPGMITMVSSRRMHIVTGFPVR